MCSEFMFNVCVYAGVGVSVYGECVCVLCVLSVCVCVGV